MPKYDTGRYLVYIFDRYGGRKKDQVLVAANYCGACALGEEYKGDGSYVVLRILHNSLDPHPTVLYDLTEEESDDHK